MQKDSSEVIFLEQNNRRIEEIATRFTISQLFVWPKILRSTR